ncbi:MAG TPA: amidohydrolase [Thermoplasmata archaeon]|nr:amidohydrolase [Thermoplasmata archaeon]
MSGAVLWTGGRVFTGARYVESLLIEDGRVIGAGPLDALRRLAPTGTEHRDLEGRLVLPGLIDPHLHLTEIARVRDGLDLSGTRSLEELVSAVALWGASHPSGPIVGRGWDPERWSGRTWPDAFALDRAVRDRPVVLYHVSGHAAVVNGAALEEIGVTAAGSTRSDPTIGQYSDGRPNGLLFEDALRPLAGIARAAAPVGPDQLAATLAEISRGGITAVGSMGASPDEVGALEALESGGRLGLTVRAYVRLSDRAIGGNRRPSSAVGRFRIAGVKAYVDGAFGTRTAWLAEPYADSPGSSGLAVGEEATLAAELSEAADLGLAPALHAIGDRAAERAVRLLEPLRGRTRAPPRIEHAALLPPGLYAALDRVRPTLVVQPGFVWSDGWLADRLGAIRARTAYRFRTLFDRGVLLAASSDAPFDPVDPWRGIRAAVRRRGPSGRSANPDPGEALTAEAAVYLYSAGAAGALGLEDRGRLEPGSAADLVVLSCPDLIRALDGAVSPVEETWVDGQCLYRADGSLTG